MKAPNFSFNLSGVCLERLHFPDVSDLNLLEI